MDCLRELDKVVVSRLLIFLDYFSNTNTKYAICDGSDRQLLLAVQDNSFASLFLPNAFVTFLVMNTDIRQVLQLDRPRKLFKVSRMNVYAPSTRYIGSIRNKSFSLLRQSFRVLDATKKLVYKIRGPIFPGTTRIPYNIYNGKGVRVGTITRKLRKFPRELVFEGDIFVVTFPKDMSVTDKSLLVGVTFYLVRPMYLYL